MVWLGILCYDLRVSQRASSVSGTAYFPPIFFAGIVFGVSFARTDSPSRDFASNIGGVVLGAVTENLSLLLGFRALLLLALG